MEITPEVTKWVRQSAEGMRRKFGSIDPETFEDLVQDVYVRLMENDEEVRRNLRNLIGFEVLTVFSGHLNKENRRRELERENGQEILSNTTPTLSKQWAGGPEEEALAEEALRRRWNQLSPLLRRVARRSFFGYMESPEKVARELGMTVAAVNMARTRIKKQLIGETDGKV